MTTRPMIFTTESVIGILTGRKTQTRRVIREQPSGQTAGYWHLERCITFGGRTWAEWETNPGYIPLKWSTKCPYGQPGDSLWIREAWRPCQVPQCGDSQCVEYRATERCRAGHLATLNRTGWRSPWFLPRRLARATRLPIAEIRVELLQSISEADAKAEGVNSVAEYMTLWDTINGKLYPWAARPWWVWVVEFPKVTG